jgi:hypothetical protein
MTIKLDIVSQYSDKGSKKAKKDLNGLTSTAKKLAGAFGVAFGIGAIKNFAVASIKAYAADEAAAKSLEMQLKNTGNAFATKSVEDYIASLQKTFRVLDDNLRPAYQTLLTSTGSVLDTQKALNVALDISAATGKDLQSVSQALAKGYTGQTAAIQKLGVGIDKATLASGDMNKILDILSNKFKGQASVAADTYQGKLNALAIASANAKEIIGKDLLDAISLLAKDDSIDSAASAMEKLATQTGNVVYGLATLIAKAKELPVIADAFSLLMDIPALRALEALAEFGASQKPAARAGRSFQGGQTSNDTYIANLKQIAIEKARLAAQKKQTDLQKAQLKATQEAAKLKKSQGLLDIQQAGILVALQGKISENEKLRLELQLALLTGNSKEADRLSNELLLSQGRLTGLATFISNLPKALNPFADYPAYVQAALAELAKLAAAQKSIGSQQGSSTGGTSVAEFVKLGIDTGVAQGLVASSARMQAQADAYFKANPNIDRMSGQVINVTVNGATAGLLDELQNGLINNSASGSQSKINRLSLID